MEEYILLLENSTTGVSYVAAAIPRKKTKIYKITEVSFWDLPSSVQKKVLTDKKKAENTLEILSVFK